MMYSLHDGGKTPTVSTRAPMVKVFGWDIMRRPLVTSHFKSW